MPEVVDLISDNDSESNHEFRTPHNPIVQQSDNPVISTFLSERVQLEKERRERQKRLRSQSGLHDSEGESEERPPKRHHLSSSVGTRTDRLPRSRSSTAASSDSARQPPAAPAPRADEEELFLDGELRQTAAQHGEPRRDGRPTFRLTQILGKVCIGLDLHSRSSDYIIIRDPNLPLPFYRPTH
jgi:tyrosyl-DNA phosphodiesterase 1